MYYVVSMRVRWSGTVTHRFDAKYVGMLYCIINYDMCFSYSVKVTVALSGNTAVPLG